MNEIPATSESEEHDKKGRDFQDSIAKCHMCLEELDASQLELHIIEVHNENQLENDGQLKTECMICDKTFPDKRSINFHLENVHKESNFRCHLCDNTFNQKSNSSAERARQPKAASRA